MHIYTARYHPTTACVDGQLTAGRAVHCVNNFTILNKDVANFISVARRINYTTMLYSPQGMHQLFPTR